MPRRKNLPVKRENELTRRPPREHLRRLETGEVVKVNEGVKPRKSSRLPEKGYGKVVPRKREKKRLPEVQSIKLMPKKRYFSTEKDFEIAVILNRIYPPTNQYLLTEWHRKTRNPAIKRFIEEWLDDLNGEGVISNKAIDELEEFIDKHKGPAKIVKRGWFKKNPNYREWIIEKDKSGYTLLISNSLDFFIPLYWFHKEI